MARPADDIIILAPHGVGAPKWEEIAGVKIKRFRYFYPDRFQTLAYPAILPNIKKNPLLVGQVPFLVWAEYLAARRINRQLQEPISSMRTGSCHKDWSHAVCTGKPAYPM